MADATSRYSFPYQENTDAPDGPLLGQDLAESVESALGDVEDALLGMSTAPSQQVFTSNGTWNKPAGAIKVLVEVVGGGGAGGGGTATSAGQWALGDGGGGGEYAAGFFDASALASTVSVTVGAGGTGGTGAGNAGNTTSFGAHITAAGGGGGATRPAGTLTFSQNRGLRAGGTGGTGGTVRVPGGTGGLGMGLSATSVVGGDGGTTVLGGGAANVGAGGVAGKAYGGGGSGAAVAQSSSAANGGAGASGVCIVTTWFAGP